MAKIEILGIEKVKAAFAALPQDMQPQILRSIATKPAQGASRSAKSLQPIGNTGATARTIGILKVKSSRQSFVEVGYRGRSLGHIYTSKDVISRRNRGSVKGFPWLFSKAGDTIRGSARHEMSVELSKTFARAFKKRGVGR